MTHAERAIAKEVAALTAEVERREAGKFRQYFPDHGLYRRKLYPKQIEFFAAGARYKERLFMAANRTGKTESGAFEVTCHVTGLYPPWWQGRRFTEPVEVWACGTTSETTRDIVQEKLFGKMEAFGTGMIPGHLLIHQTKRPHGLPGSIESAWVRHVRGGKSLIGLKMYEQGRTSFEGTGKHVIWCDEEPPQDCYTEMLYRTITTKGIVLVTFTPLQGMSGVVSSFLEPDNEDANTFKTVIQAGWDDVPHLDPAEKSRTDRDDPPVPARCEDEGSPAARVWGDLPDAGKRAQDSTVRHPLALAAVLGDGHGSGGGVDGSRLAGARSPSTDRLPIRLV